VEEICVGSLSVVLLSVVSYGHGKHVTCLLFIMETDPNTSYSCLLLQSFFYFFLCHSEFLSAALCRAYMWNGIKLEQHIYFEIRYYSDSP